MNVTETIFALALASNCQPQQNFQYAYAAIARLGAAEFSKTYLIPCRDGVGADYWNSACLLRSRCSVEQLQNLLKQLEAETGRVRPSHQISLDIDLIAWGNSLSKMEFNPKKMPLALDVKIPLHDLWRHESLKYPRHSFEALSPI
ncbi:2-amino-4-hydroxy-6-hydroxymethyldihydropteridine diphosphokinase [Acinetobacter tianfuensis]|uniref:2-amino-4-hydroxy-6-hydroxymethyldihydropteridine diphosphokinase n=1 Tax=Acinetobacter tianfuensis TaxID=2419603 RepID=A0A3A8EZY8_9GAMM|nr:2-amino-4-hydroxy-6-hydroxymethyldihydropteridine diphosphokinase [Acinetobacter tianfuensis]RKG34003.1 2-amino-4-hydroxy-6-hydroxymethyldihydropteridine pyrophosphokinase [Acinetobacter tianfuensis]